MTLATIATIRADLIGSSAVFRAEMQAGARQANQSLVSIRAETKATADSIVAMNRAAMGFIGFQAVKRGVGELVDAQLKMQSIHYTLLAATGSAQLAGQAFEFVQDRAHTLGLDLEPTAEGFARLSASATALGVSVSDQQALFDAYAKSSTTLHLSSEKSSSALMALEQMMGKGKIQAQELRLQLGQAIPGAAARFQAAVMEMIKGTDLAGKSFDQLLQAGDLTTTRFLPALVSALQESGRGWEEASHGMNAELNRLRTNWFQMKADVSGGLFNDVATGSIRLMADNLGHLADVAGVTGGLIVSRLAGVGLGKVYDSGASAVAAQRQAREAAESAGALAKANVEVTATQVKSTEAALRGATVARKQAFEQRGAAEALHAKALAENNAAQATLAHQQGTMTLSANIRAQREAAAAAAVAQNNLARAQRQYDAAVAGGNALKQQQIALEARLIEAKVASVTATEAQILAERQLAATTSGSMLARGAKSFGNFALGLVGGPWGAAVAAIGAVGYAIYDLNKVSERWRQETQEQVKSLQNVREQVRGAAADYGQLHAAMNLSQTLDAYLQSSDELQKKRDEISGLQQQAEDLQKAMSMQGGGGPLAGMHLEQLNSRIKELQDQLPATTQEVDALGAKLAGSMAPAIDAVKSAIDRLRGGGSLRDVFSGWSDDIDAGIKAVDQAKSDVESGLSALASQGKTWAKKASTDGKTAVQQANAQLDEIVANIKKQALPAVEAAKQIAAARKEASTPLAAAAMVDAADAAKKNASEAASAAKRWKDQADSLNQSLQQTRNELLAQLDSTTKLTPPQKVLQDIIGGTSSAYNHATSALKAKMLAEAQDNAELSKKVVLQQQATKDAAAYAVVQENLARIAQQSAREHQDSLSGIGQGSKATADQQGLTAVRRQYEDLMAQAGRSLRSGHISQGEYDKEVADYKVALDQMLRATAEFYDQRNALQDDWKNGAIRAMEDWGDAAANNADLAAGVVTNAATNMTNAFVEFAVAGKLSFKDFADSLIRDLARIAYQKAIAGIFESALGSYMGYDATGGAGASTYNAMGGVTHVDFGGGRAGGGSTSGGSIYEVAEGGRPELYQSAGRTYLLSGSDGHVTPASRGNAAASAGGAAVSDIEVQINITNSGQAVQAQQTGQRMDGKKMIIDMVLQAVQSDIAKGGGTAQAMQQRFGLQRRGVPVGS